MILEVLLRIITGRNRPFKFQTYWLTDPIFPRIITQAWGQAHSLADALENFTKDAITWNKMQFGNIFARKKNIMVRLNGIQRAVSFRPSSFLQNLENELPKELNMVLNQEEEL